MEQFRSVLIVRPFFIGKTRITSHNDSSIKSGPLFPRFRGCIRATAAGQRGRRYHLDNHWSKRRALGTGRLELVGNLAERIFGERFLQLRFLAVTPFLEQRFAFFYRAAVFGDNRSAGDFLRDFTKLAERPDAAFTVDPRVAFNETTWISVYACFAGFVNCNARR